MPYCPGCGSEYRAGFTTCIECHLPLVDKLPPIEPSRPPASVKVVRLAEFPSQIEGEMWSDVLQSEGIPSVLVPLGAGASFGSGGTVWTPHEMRVRESDLERAREILRETPVEEIQPGDPEDE